MPEHQVNTEFKEKCDEFNTRLELYSLIAEGFKDIENGDVRLFSEVMAEFEEKYKV